MAVHSDMQGPCPDGFHVPTKDEWTAVKTVWTTLGGGDTDGANFGIAFKLPFAGFRDRMTSGTNNQDTRGSYWSSIYYNGGSNAYHLLFKSSDIYTSNYNPRSMGYSVRGFKNSPVVPDNTWTTLKSGTGSAGIFWSSTLGLISMSGDGTTWITIADKNVGATTVWNSGDTLSEANCGKYFQRGNNYGFDWTGTITDTSSTQVDASNYGPGNYYSSSTFITYNGRWDTTDNTNLWGGVSQGTRYDLKSHGHIGTWHMEHIQYTNYSAMRGPCPEGYHIGSDVEWNDILNAGKNIGAWGIYPSGGGTNFQTYLKIPKAGMRKSDTGAVGSSSGDGPGYVGVYWTCSTSSNFAKRFNFSDEWVAAPGGDGRLCGAHIRPIKDEPVTPDSSWTTLYDGSSVATGAGIFHNATEGLISMSGDGTNWLTISDKNLGATTIYNYGNTLTDANCGYFYQWGNNYGFPFTGNVTTSSTQVDASNYGPGNYYSNSTFIIGNNYPYDWSSVQNDNLWGGVTGPVQVDKYVPRGST